MKEQLRISETNRREMLRLSGMGVLGGVAVGALTSGKAQAAEPIKIPYASWIHGHSMQIEYPDRIVSERRTGYGINIEGKSGTANWFHFAIPTPICNRRTPAVRRLFDLRPCVPWPGSR